MSEPTTGPYTCNNNTIYAAGQCDTIWGPVFVPIAQSTEIRGEDGNGRMWWCDGSAEANARLFAASWEMWKALQAALSHLSDIYDPLRMSEAEHAKAAELADTLNAGLAKAEGKTDE